MIPYDRGIRNLVPLLLEDPDELELGLEDDAGRPALTSEIPQSDHPTARVADEPMRIPAPPEHEATAPPIETPHPLSSGSWTNQIHSEASGPDIQAPSSAVEPGLFDQTFMKAGAAATAHGGDHSQPAQDAPSASVSVSEVDRPAQTGMDPPTTGSGDGEGGAQPIPADGLSDPGDKGDGEHDIDVTQTADVDQDATIVVQGYMGSVVSRFHIDQKILMDQDADIDVNIDGNGHFAITIDQKMYISQQTDLDLKIFDDDGVLYVDLYLRDVIEVDQDTSVLFNMYDGFGDNDLVIIQDLEMDQDVDVDVDVEDELEERYDVKVDVSVLQDADADEEANLQITNHAGELEVDLEANQVAHVDQETFVKIDFALV
ncbi:hypothetical protein [Microvirga subterranea]|uniref:Uncharacterized protein n=1 Tax=Microvirga subterranea TaxID=186651 RepID=A0A370HNE5_9HYPH|nr:hypothetical protein [Microvirga subterranea]RDI59967.1 hypothetical protein DES45_103225 [Microvirga subterranea]